MKIMIGTNKHLELVGEFLSADEALDQIQVLMPDVVFADVEMPALNGIELSQKIKSIHDNIQIVFVTAHEKYAIEAFKVQAVNYILKPITQEELNITVNRLVKNYNNQINLLRTPSTNHILLLGGLKVYGNAIDEEVKWPTIKARELFAYFVYNREKELDKWELCDILWPDAPAAKAEQNLYSAINRMKSSLKQVGVQDVLKCEKGKYSMDLRGFSCDVWEFTEFIENNPFVSAENILKCERNLGLYQGGLFGSEGYSWAAELRENINLRFLRSAKNIGLYYIEHKKYDKAEKLLQKAIQMDAGDEETAEFMMKLYFLTENKQALVDTYKSLVYYLKEEMGISPKKSTQQLYNDLLIKL